MKKYLLILLFVSYLGNAQYNLFARQNFAKSASVPTYNTYIGGISGSVSTASALATKLGISVGNISNFTIVGSDIKCKITGSYTLGSNFNGDTAVTYFYDNDNLVTSLSSTFQNATNFTSFKFEGVTSIINVRCFERTNLETLNLPALTSASVIAFADGINKDGKKVDIYMPNCATLGVNVNTNESVFTGLPSGSNLYLKPSLSTVNSGGEEADVAYARSLGANIRYVTDYTAPVAVSTLTAGTIYNTAIQLTWTAPVGSTNAIDFYELYVNGVYVKKIVSGDYVTGLALATSYNLTVYARDIFYNKSSVSNIVTQSTDNYSYTDTDANASISAKSLTGSEAESEYLLITGLKANSLYTRCQAIYTFKGTTASQHKFNSKNPIDTDAAFRLTFSGAATYENSGYTPNGTTGYADTHFLPSVNQSVNNNGITLVVGTNNAATSNAFEVGTFKAQGQCSLISAKNDNSNYQKRASINNNLAPVVYNGDNNARGILSGVKQSSTVTTLIKNGMVLSSGSSGGTLSDLSFSIGAFNLGASRSGFSNQRIQMVLFHEGFSDAETATAHSIIDLSEIIAGRKNW